MALMLFFLGLFGSYLILGKQFAERIQEAVLMEVQIHDGIASSELDRFAREIGKAAYAESVEYVSKSDALAEYEDRFGNSFTEHLGGLNPLLASFRVKLWPSYIEETSLAHIKEELMADIVVESVDYPLKDILKLQENIRKVSWTTLGLGILLLAIAFYMIFGTIRLGIYAKRLAIRTMQLVGATDSFIRRPFIISGLIQGAIAGCIAAVSVSVAWWLLSLWSPAPLPIWHLGSTGFIGLLGGILLLGLFLGWTGSYLAVNRYLHKNLDQLMRD